MKNARKYLKHFFSNKANIFAIIFILLTAATTYAFARENEFGLKFIALIIFVEIAIEAGLIALYHFLDKRGVPIEKKFLAIAIPLGLLFTFILPIDRTPDACLHVARAYNVSKGILIAPSNEAGETISQIPVELSWNPDKSWDSNIWQPLSGEYREETNVAASTYNFVPYIPQAIAMFIGNMLHLPFVIVLWLGRIAGFATFLLLAYLAIKLAPRYKYFLAFIALLPMTLQEVTTFTSDLLTIGIAFLVFAYTFHLIDQNRKLKNSEITVLYLLAIILATCKFIYLPLCLLYLLIPKKLFGSGKRKWINLILMATGAALTIFLWAKLQAPNSGAIRTNSDNLDLIIHRPITFFRYLILNTFNDNTGFYLSSAFGTSLGYFEYPVASIFFYLSLVFSVLLLANGIERPKIPLSTKLISIISFSSIFLTTLCVMYVEFTGPGGHGVSGVQGRYFTPIFPLIPLMLSSPATKTKEKPSFSAKYALFFLIFFNVCILSYIFVINLTRLR